MKILITGGCGYVGSVLTQDLLRKRHDVIVYDIMWFGNYLREHPKLTITQGDIREIDSVPMNGVDAVIHLANIANDPCSDLNSKLNWEVNVLATKLLVEKAIASGVSQFIYASSGSVYGYKEEEQVTEELSLVPLSDYNKTKMISERVLLSYSNNLLVQIVRPATVCGYSPRMRLDLSVNILTSQAYNNQRLTVFGGSQTRPNIHIRDMVGVYLHFLEQGEAIQGIYNAGFENLSILEIAERASVKIPSEIVISESNDPRSYRLNSNKLLATGYKQEFTVDDAMEEVITAFRDSNLKEEDQFYNIRTMKTIFDLR
jgi:nucleoside-diphosphate-sugar epimerase